MLWIDILIALITLTVFSAEESFKVALDDPVSCGIHSWRLETLKDGMSAIVVGKSMGENHSSMSECNLLIGPDTAAKKQRMKIRFDSFYIRKCVIRLDILQSAGTEPEKAVSMAVLTCKSSTPEDLYTKPQHNVFLTIKKADVSFLGYNFRINISLSDGPPPERISVTTIAVVSVSVIVVIFVALYFLQRTFYVQRKFEDRQDILQSRSSRQRRTRSSLEDLTELPSSPRRPRDRTNVANGEPSSNAHYRRDVSLFRDSLTENDTVFIDDSVLPGDNDERPPEYEAPPPYNDVIAMDERRRSSDTTIQKNEYSNL